MSSKLTELTESSLSAPPPSILHGSGILSQFSSPSMASSGHFDPTQTYDDYKAVEVLYPAFTECLVKGKDCFEHYNPRLSKCHYCFIGKKPCRLTGNSEVPISVINTEGIVKSIRRIANSPPDPDVEGSDELNGEEVEVIPHSSGQQSNDSPLQAPAKRFQSQVIPSTPETSNPLLLQFLLPFLLLHHTLPAPGLP
ncbi:hypothetical protein O181_036670 [Austropuccinia psidii MF-1]|uniref:Uncharacterized protein n=1 Tax=Austropuccinia psidii MF-1 TaxID=1389203 RepID=A0A9Q3D9E1_9BASI|nr:hypothetical protein [Austropuccinia psidii MF-1]